MKHKFAALFGLLLSASIVWGQNPNSQGAPISSPIFALPVTTLNAVPVAGATLQTVGVTGQATYCYWAVANFQVGSLLSPLGCVQNGANTLSGSNYVGIFPFAYPPGSTVDILRTGNNFVSPTGACNCAVATGLTSGGVNDQSNSLSSYTVSIIDPNHYAQTLTNEVISPGVSHLILRQGWPWPKTFVCDLSIGCGGLPGTGYLPCQTGIGDGLNAIPSGTYLQSFCFNDSGVALTITGIRCFTDNNGTSTVNAADNLGNALLAGAITCTNSFAAGTQSVHVSIPNHGWIAFMFVADGTSKQTTWAVTE